MKKAVRFMRVALRSRVWLVQNFEAMELFRGGFTSRIVAHL
jgi:hypothetical protein